MLEGKRVDQRIVERLIASWVPCTRKTIARSQDFRRVSPLLRQRGGTFDIYRCWCIYDSCSLRAASMHRTLYFKLRGKSSIIPGSRQRPQKFLSSTFSLISIREFSVKPAFVFPTYDNSLNVTQQTLE